MPTKAFSAINLNDEETIKRCPPFVDAMTCGFLIPLICDLKIENGEITWDNELPPGGSLDYPRSPIGFHDKGQVSVRRFSTPIASSSNSTTYGPSKPRKATRCSSRIPSIALISHSPLSAGWSIATAIRIPGYIFRHIGITQISRVSFRRAHRSRSAFQSSGKTGLGKRLRSRHKRRSRFTNSETR